MRLGIRTFEKPSSEKSSAADGVDALLLLEDIFLIKRGVKLARSVYGKNTTFLEVAEECEPEHGNRRKDDSSCSRKISRGKTRCKHHADEYRNEYERRAKVAGQNDKQCRNSAVNAEKQGIFKLVYILADIIEMNGECYYKCYFEKLGRLEVDDFEIEPCSCIRSVCCSAAEREKQKHHQQAHAADYHPEAENYFVVDK